MEKQIINDIIRKNLIKAIDLWGYEKTYKKIGELSCNEVQEVRMREVFITLLNE